MDYVRVKIFQFIQFDALRGGHVDVSWSRMLGGAYQELANLPLVDQLTHIVARGFANREKFLNGGSQTLQLLQFAEFCAGFANLSKKLLQADLRGASYDILFRPEHDMLSFAGLQLFIDSVTASCDKALHWMGTPCGSFVHICSSVSRRSETNSYEGDVARDFVRRGNAMAEITALIVFISCCLNCISILEQPSTSCMPKLSSLTSVFQFFHFEKTTTYLGCFGAPTRKQLQLWHPPGTFGTLSRARPDDMLFAETLVDRSENGSYTGKKNELSQSEKYPPQFGQAVADRYLQIM